MGKKIRIIMINKIRITLIKLIYHQKYQQKNDLEEEKVFFEKEQNQNLNLNSSSSKNNKIDFQNLLNVKMGNFVSEFHQPFCNRNNTTFSTIPHQFYFNPTQ